MAKYNTEEHSNKLNIISAGTTIVGDITSEGDIRIDGILKGTLKVTAKLVLGNSGSIVGEVFCKTADISGIIEGKVISEDLLYMKETAKINGDITTSKLSIEQGAEFSGTCNMKGNIERKIVDTIKNDEETKTQPKS